MNHFKANTKLIFYIKKSLFLSKIWLKMLSFHVFNFDTIFHTSFSPSYTFPLYHSYIFLLHIPSHLYFTFTFPLFLIPLPILFHIFYPPVCILNFLLFSTLTRRSNAKKNIERGSLTSVERSILFWPQYFSN